MSRIWFITGASRGLGLEIAKAALSAGDAVAAAARDVARIQASLGESERVLPLALDVTGASAAQVAVDAAVHRFGRIDVVVNNAGQAHLGWFETLSDAAVRRQFEINLFGPMNVLRAALPHLRAQRAGLLVTISSVNGLVSNAGGSIYSASKFAVEGWIEGLAQEVLPLGIRSLTVNPGMLRTDFLDPGSAHIGDIEIEDYAEAVAQFKAFIAGANHAQPGDPVALASRIVALAGSDAPPPRLVFGEDALAWAAEKTDRLKAEISVSPGLGP